MKPISASQVIAAPPEAVFEAAIDFPSAPGRIRGIKRLRMLTDGPVRVGTRFEETREMFGREATETMEITAFDPPRSYTLGADSHGCLYRSELRFEPDGAGTRVTMTFTAKPLTFAARVMTFLMAPLAKMMVKECAKDLADLGAACEARTK